MNRYRRAFAALAVAALAVIVAGAAADEPNIQDHYVRSRAVNFVRQPDTLCAAATDTIVGPSIWCFGAKAVYWRVQANAGTCSLLTIETSNNDTAWFTVLSGGQMDNTSEFTVGDSLNSGGRTTGLYAGIASITSAAGIPARFCRAVVRRRVGYATTTASAGPTVACRTRVDSLRFKGYVTWAQP